MFVFWTLFDVYENTNAKKDYKSTNVIGTKKKYPLNADK